MTAILAFVFHRKPQISLASRHSKKTQKRFLIVIVSKAHSLFYKMA